MVIRDGICYADNFEEVLKVTSVSTQNYLLKITFSTGETKVYDFTPLLEYPVFQHLKDVEIFSKCYIDENFGVVCWDERTDIATEWLYEQGSLV